MNGCCPPRTLITHRGPSCSSGRMNPEHASRESTRSRLVASAPSNSGWSRWVSSTPSRSGVSMGPVYPVPRTNCHCSFGKIWFDLLDGAVSRGKAGREPGMAFSGWPEEALDFYDGLAADNAKGYWTANKAVYQDKVLRPMTELTEELAAEFGEPKIFRPYRDVRFSRDNTPYKTHIGAVLGNTGYVQFSVEGLGAGAGMWEMSPEQLARYREAVAGDRTGKELERIAAELEQTGITVHGHGALKSAPRGYPADHPRIALLRYKGLTAWQQWPVGPWLDTASAKDRIVPFLRTTRPLCSWLTENVRGVLPRIGRGAAVVRRPVRPEQAAGPVLGAALPEVRPVLPQRGLRCLLAAGRLADPLHQRRFLDDLRRRGRHGDDRREDEPDAAQAEDERQQEGRRAGRGRRAHHQAGGAAHLQRGHARVVHAADRYPHDQRRDQRGPDAVQPEGRPQRG